MDNTDSLARGTGVVGDEDSLFGSPPSSPATGRSPKLDLALPSGSTSSTQNVGTIALPGPSFNSELSVPSPASSLSRSSHPHGRAQRPPANHDIQFRMSTPANESQASPAPVTQSLLAQPPNVKSSGRKRQRTAGPSRPPSTPISLPDSDQPLPPNFLRNQQGLLGHAGLVAGLKPASLPNPRSRGSSAHNPILIDEEEQHAQPSISRKHRNATADPSQLLPPSTDEIVASVTRQPDTFAIFESFVKLINSDAANGSQSRQKQQSSGWARGTSAVKRRRLSSVPAGAADWDVPYPFAAGEGPEEYRENWEKERAKQLVKQLVALVKGSAQKAALRSYVRKQKEPQQEAQYPPKTYYKPRTATYGLDTNVSRTALSEAGGLADQSNSPIPSSPFSSQETEMAEKMVSLFDLSLPTTFNEIVASLMSEKPKESEDADSTTPASTSTNHPLNTSEESTPIPDFGQAAFDRWMSSICEAQPDEALFSVDQPFTGQDVDLTIERSVSLAPVLPVDDTSRPTVCIPDAQIDPLLLALSCGTPTATETQHGLASGIPLLSRSPLTSASSLVDPLTPCWDSTYIDTDVSVAVGPDNVNDHLNELSGQLGMFQIENVSARSGKEANVMPLPASAPPTPVPSMYPLSQPDAGSMEEGDAISFLASASSTPLPFMRPLSQYDGQSLVPPVSVIPGEKDSLVPAPTPVSEVTVRPKTSVRPAAAVPEAGPSRPPVTRPSRGVKHRGKTIDKNSILQRAKERRRQLLAEIERAKVELWETTIEQGVLTHIVKDTNNM